MVDCQLNQAVDVLKQFEVCATHPQDGSTDKRQRKMTDKGSEYKKETLDKREQTWCQDSSENLVRQMFCSHQNVTVKKELAQLSGIFKLIEDINQEMIDIDQVIRNGKIIWKHGLYC